MPSEKSIDGMPMRPKPKEWWILYREYAVPLAFEDRESAENYRNKFRLGEGGIRHVVEMDE